MVLGKYCKDVAIDVYEERSQFTEIGAGVSVWNRMWMIMQTLGLDEKLGKLAAQLPVKEPSELPCAVSVPLPVLICLRRACTLLQKE